MLFHRALLNMALNSSLDRDIKLIDIRVDWLSTSFFVLEKKYLSQFRVIIRFKWKLKP
jgi:hypothetical protein